MNYGTLLKAGQRIDFTNLTGRIQNAVKAMASVALDGGDWELLYQGKAYSGISQLASADIDVLLSDIETVVEESGTKDPVIDDDGMDVIAGISSGNIWAGVDMSLSIERSFNGVRKVINDEIREGAISADMFDEVYIEACKLLGNEIADYFKAEARSEIERMASEFVESYQLDLQLIPLGEFQNESEKAVENMLKDARYDIGAFIDKIDPEHELTQSDYEEVYARYDKELDPLVAFFDDFMADGTKAAYAYFDLRELEESEYGDKDIVREIDDKAWEHAQWYLLQKISRALANR